MDIRPRERDAVLQSLRAGVVPRIGLQHIQVGRKDEVAALLQDLERIEQGSAAVRFVIGRFGAGKTFFLNLVRAVAMERRFVVLTADLTTTRRLYGSGGQARALYAELLRNAAVRAKPEGGALASVVERWVSSVEYEVRDANGTDTDVVRAIHDRLRPLQDLVSGYDFSAVLAKYFEGYQADNEHLMNAALRWLRGEYASKLEARQDLGVRSIVDDDNVYDYLKLFAAFVKLSGYAGLLVNLDEMGVLSHRLNNAQSRNANYEMILRIVNDCLQGNAEGIGFLFGGTDAFLEDRRRGLFSYEALATRLAENSFAANGLRDLSGPVIRLANLSPEELYILLHNIRHVQAGGDPGRYLLGDDALQAFMLHCARTLGAEYFATPRDTAKAFAGLLSILEQHPEARWQDVLTTTRVERTADPESTAIPDADSAPASHPDDDHAGDELATFRL
jgi:hypothetical protein